MLRVVSMAMPHARMAASALHACFCRRRNGSFFCQVFLSPGGLNYDFGGDYTWSKPPVATNRFYEGGFAISDALIGSRYATPGATNRVLPFSEGLMTFSGGNLGAPFVNQILLRPNNSVTNTPASTNKLTFTLNKTNGLFSGTVAEPNSTRVLAFKGAVLTKAGTGHGFFLGTNQSGRVLFETVP